MSNNTNLALVQGGKSPATVEDLQQRDMQAALFEKVVIGGDLSKLSAEERVRYYIHRCEAADLDPRTQPFAYLTLKGKLTLYATKTATEQYARKHQVSVDIISKTLDTENHIYEVEAVAYGPSGRRVMNMGALSVQNLRGEDLCNARMKAVTKASRRAIIAYGGLGVVDESEIDSIPDARIVEVDSEGNILGPVGGPNAALMPHVGQRPRISRRSRMSELPAGTDTSAETQEQPINEPSPEDAKKARSEAMSRLVFAYNAVTGFAAGGANGEAKRFTDYCKRSAADSDKHPRDMDASELDALTEAVKSVPALKEQTYSYSGLTGWHDLQPFLKECGLELNPIEVLVTAPEWTQALVMLQAKPAYEAEIVNDDQGEQGDLFSRED